MKSNQTNKSLFATVLLLILLVSALTHAKIQFSQVFKIY